MGRRQFTRSSAITPPRRNFFISSEGRITEHNYFKDLRQLFKNVNIIPIPHKGTKPQDVLNTLKEYIAKKNLTNRDKAWVVIDKDRWKETELNKIYTWTCTSQNYGLALSNPNFEYWLLLHFEHGNGLSPSADLTKLLKTYIKSYDKRNKIFPKSQLTRKCFEEASKRAKARGTTLNNDWPREFGRTTMYLLADELIQNN